MPRLRSETQQFGYVMLPTNPFSPASTENPLVLVPPLWWVRGLKALPSPFRDLLRVSATFGSLSDLTASPIAESNVRAAGLLGITPLEWVTFFPGSTRQLVILSGTNPPGAHKHPAVELACTLADKTFVPLCWPIIAALVLAGKPPTTAQIVLCLIQTGLLLAFKEWCQNGTTRIGTPDPYFYGRR